MFNKSLIRVYFNEHIRCYYDGTIERFQTKRGNRTLIKPYWKVIKNVGHKPDVYNKIGINDKMYLRQRIIAFCYYGSFELDDVSVDVDHRDGNTINNCVENLKVGTHRQNCLNRKDAKNYSLVKIWTPNVLDDFSIIIIIIFYNIYESYLLHRHSFFNCTIGYWHHRFLCINFNYTSIIYINS